MAGYDAPAAKQQGDELVTVGGQEYTAKGAAMIRSLREAQKREPERHETLQQSIDFMLQQEEKWRNERATQS